MPMFRQAGEFGLQIPCGHRPLAGAEYLLGTLMGVVPAIYASRTRLLRTAGADRRRLSFSTPEGRSGRWVAGIPRHSMAGPLPRMRAATAVRAFESVDSWWPSSGWQLARKLVERHSFGGV